jgi:hypothetical protein
LRPVPCEIPFTLKVLAIPGGGKELLSFRGPQFDREIAIKASPQSQDHPFGEQVEGVGIEEIYNTSHFILEVKC